MIQPLDQAPFFTGVSGGRFLGVALPSLLSDEEV
jgi:hypothetical protein